MHLFRHRALLRLSLNPLIILFSSPSFSVNAAEAHLAFASQSMSKTAACTDYYQAVNRDWLTSPSIPIDSDIFFGLAEQSHARLLSALQAVLAAKQAQRPTPSSSDLSENSANLRKLIDLHRSFHDRDTLEALGLTPITAELTSIDALTHLDQLPELLAKLYGAGVTEPLSLSVNIAPSIDNAQQNHYKGEVRYTASDNNVRATEIARLLQLSGVPRKSRSVSRRVSITHDT